MIRSPITRTGTLKPARIGALVSEASLALPCRYFEFRYVLLYFAVEFLNLGSTRSIWDAAVHFYRLVALFAIQLKSDLLKDVFGVRFKLQKYLHLSGAEVRKNTINTLPIVLQHLVLTRHRVGQVSNIGPFSRSDTISICFWIGRPIAKQARVSAAEFAAVCCDWLEHCVDQRSRLPFLLRGSAIRRPDRGGNCTDRAERVSPQCRHWFENFSVPNWCREGEGKQQAYAGATDKCPPTAPHKAEIELHLMPRSYFFGIVA
jgi:hypothetical protein